MPTRRQFVAKCTKLAVTVSVLPSSALSATFGRGAVSLEGISFNDFASSVNSHFSVVADGRAVTWLQLVRVKPHAAPVAGSEDEANERFSLLFSGPNSAPLDSAIYRFEHAGLGRFEMFISPVGQAGPEKSYYEAVFNRPAPRNSRPNRADS